MVRFLLQLNSKEVRTLDAHNERDQIWQLWRIFKVFDKIFACDSLLLGKSFNPFWQFLCHWSDFHFWKWPSFEQTTLSFGHIVARKQTVHWRMCFWTVFERFRKKALLNFITEYRIVHNANKYFNKEWLKFTHYLTGVTRFGEISPFWYF